MLDIEQCCAISNSFNVGQKIVRVHPRYFRPTEVHKLLGDSSKAKNELGWEPKVTLEELISQMIKNDSDEAKKELILKNEGFNLPNPLETIPNIFDKE